jgi:AraC family transcriptional regulator
LEAISLVRHHIASHVSLSVESCRGRLLVWQARKVREYIDVHLTSTVRVADLCELIQRSEGHFSRAFKRTFGEPPHAFLKRRRVDLAAHYMLNTNASLSDISVRCGFTDQAHFSKIFRRLTGETPAAWRRTRTLT